jgi:uncharacterized membrane protein (DUF373 family)
MKTPEDYHARSWISRAFTVVEDIVYVGLGLLLGASAIVLLVSGVISFGRSLVDGSFPEAAVALLDRILLILLIVELLYTVQVSFREHALLPEPFLLVGLIAAIRRVLVLTAEFGQKSRQTEEMFRNFLIELAVLTGLILAITISLMLLRRQNKELSERSQRA